MAYYCCYFAILIFLVQHQVGDGQPRCEQIVAPMCQGLGYNTTNMPNLLLHTTQDEAIRELDKFNSLLTNKCSPFLRLFVCSVYIPFCSEYVPGAVPACKSLCEEVQRDCYPALQAAGFTQLNCSRFPEPSDLCMQQPPDEEELNYSLANDLKEAYLMERLRNRNCPPATMRSGTHCLPINQSKFIYENEDTIIVQVWIAIWSILSLIVVLFTLLTFMIQPKRFRWPARPILCLSACGFITSLIYFVQWMLSAVIYQDFRPLESWPCITFTLLSTFCDFAFALWWCTFSYVWYLSAAKEWSTEAIEKCAARLHSIIWSLSGVPIVYVLLTNNIKTNKFSNFCESSTSLVLIVSQLFIVSFGVVLAIFTSLALKDVRQALIDAGRSPFKLERLIYRLGIISMGISVPLLISLLCHLFDTLQIEMLKIAMKFLSVIFASFWVCSYKTFRSWTKLLRPSFSFASAKGLRNVPVTNV